MIEPTIAPNEAEPRSVAGRVVRHHAIVLCCAQSVVDMVEEVARNLRGLGFAVEVVCGAEARATLLARDRERDDPTIYVVCVQGSLKEQVLKPLRQALASHESANHHLFVAVLDLALPLAMVGQIRRFAEALERPVEGRKRDGLGERRQWREILAPASAERTPTRSYRAAEVLDRSLDGAHDEGESITRTGPQRVIGTPHAAKIATSEKYRAVTGQLPVVPLADDASDAATSGTRRRKTHAPKVRVKPVAPPRGGRRRRGRGVPASDDAPTSAQPIVPSEPAVPETIDRDRGAAPPMTTTVTVVGHTPIADPSQPSRATPGTARGDTVVGSAPLRDPDADATVPYGSFEAADGIVELGRSAPVILRDDEPSSEHVLASEDSAVVMLPSAPPPVPVEPRPRSGSGPEEEDATQVRRSATGETPVQPPARTGMTVVPTTPIAPARTGATIVPDAGDAPPRRAGLFVPPPVPPDPSTSTPAGDDDTTADARRTRLPPLPRVGPDTGRTQVPNTADGAPAPTIVLEPPARTGATIVPSDASARTTVIPDRPPLPITPLRPEDIELVPHSASAAARGDTVVAFPRPKDDATARGDTVIAPPPAPTQGETVVGPAPIPDRTPARGDTVVGAPPVPERPAPRGDTLVGTAPVPPPEPATPIAAAELPTPRDAIEVADAPEPDAPQRETPREARASAPSEGTRRRSAPVAVESTSARRDRPAFAAEVAPEAPRGRGRGLYLGMAGLLCAAGFAAVWYGGWFRGDAPAQTRVAAASPSPSESDAKAMRPREPATPTSETRDAPAPAPTSVTAVETKTDAPVETKASSTTAPTVPVAIPAEAPVEESQPIPPATPTTDAAPEPDPAPSEPTRGPEPTEPTPSEPSREPASEPAPSTDDLAKLAALADRHRLWTTEQLYVTPMQASAVGWAQARAMCERLLVDGVGGFRLPHRRELMAVQVGGFLRENPHWSRTVPEDDRESAYVLHPSTGQLSAWHKGDTAAVVCVHDRE